MNTAQPDTAATEPRMSTVDIIEDIAHELMQVGGYAELNYGTIANRLRISRTAVHHYFPNKEELGARVISRYREWTVHELEGIDSRTRNRKQRLREYVGLYRGVLERGSDHLCPGGMLAAEIVSLPEIIRDEVQAFFDLHVSWAHHRLTSNRPEDTIVAQRLVARLQGTLLLARLKDGLSSFDALVEDLIGPRTPAEPSPAD